MTEYTPICFIDEQIEVAFNVPPMLEKSPTCPNTFIWNEKTYRVIESLSEWSDFTRKGKMARNMQPAHAAVASTKGSLNVGRFYFRAKVDSNQIFAAGRGSLNVGRFYFRVRARALSGSSTAGGTNTQIFDLYYDRAMKSVDDRKGQWFVYRELE